MTIFSRLQRPLRSSYNDAHTNTNITTIRTIQHTTTIIFEHLPKKKKNIFKMVSFNVKAMGGAAAVYLLAQQCQCPPLAVPLFISAAAQVAAAVGSAGAEIAGAVIAANAKRSGKHGGVAERQVFTAPPGVPQFEFDRCTEDLAQESVSLYVQGPVSNNGM